MKIVPDDALWGAHESMRYLRKYFRTNPSSSELLWNIHAVGFSASALGSSLYPPGYWVLDTGYYIFKSTRLRRVGSFSSKLKGLHNGIGSYYQRQRIRDEGGSSGEPPGLGDLRGPDQGPWSNGEHLQR